MVLFHSIDDSFKLRTFGKAKQHRSRQVVPRACLLLWTDLKHILLSLLLSEMFLKELFLDVHPSETWRGSVVFVSHLPRLPGSARTCSCDTEPHHRALIDVVCILQGSCSLGFLPAEQRLSCCTSVILNAPGMTGQQIHFLYNESTVFLVNIVSSE